MRFIERFSNDRKVIISEIFIVAIVSVIRIYGAYITTYSTHPKIGRQVGYVLVFSTRVATLLSINNMQIHSMLMEDTLLNGTLVAGLSSDVVKVIVLLTTSIVLLGTLKVSVRDGRTAFEYPLLVCLSTLGLLFMVNANDRITLYRSIEWQSRCMYVLASFNRGSGYAVEAGMKYFVLGSVASGSIILGMTILYGGLCMVNMSEIGMYLTYAHEHDSLGVINSSIITIGWVLILSGRLFKLAVVPFHSWVADVYEGSPWSSVVYFAVVPKIALVYVLVKLVHGPFYSLMFLTSDYLYIAGILSRVIGTLGARGQSRIKRFRAYSSIGNMGYVLLGVSIYTYDGDQSTLIYIIRYTMMSAAIWLSVAIVVILNHDGMYITNKPIVILSDLTGRVYKSPLIAYAMALIMLSIAGIPPLAGFISKMRVITAMVNSGWYVSTVIVLIISSVSAFYYLHVIKIICFDKAVDNTSIVQSDTAGIVLVGLTTASIYLPLLSPIILLLITHNMVASIW